MIFSSCNGGKSAIFSRRILLELLYNQRPIHGFGLFIPSSRSAGIKNFTAGIPGTGKSARVRSISMGQDPGGFVHGPHRPDKEKTFKGYAPEELIGLRFAYVFSWTDPSVKHEEKHCYKAAVCAGITNGGIRKGVCVPHDCKDARIEGDLSAPVENGITHPDQKELMGRLLQFPGGGCKDGPVALGGAVRANDFIRLTRPLPDPGPVLRRMGGNTGVLRKFLTGSRLERVWPARCSAASGAHWFISAGEGAGRGSWRRRIIWYGRAWRRPAGAGCAAFNRRRSRRAGSPGAAFRALRTAWVSENA
jgi:hypothetical protein